MSEIDKYTAGKIMDWAKYHANRIDVRSDAFDRDDLIGVGVLAAIESYPRWDPKQAKLTTFLGHRIKGAMRDHIRQYVHGRRKANGYCDHTVERFGNIEGHWNALHASGAFDEGKTLDDVIEGSNLDGTFAFEAMEFLEHWRQGVNERDYRILFLRYGVGLTMMETGERVGLSQAMVSLIEKRLRERFGLPLLEKQTVNGVGRQRSAKIMRAPRR